MKIIILGAGQVGSTVATIMAHEDNDITVVDRDARVLRELQQHLDIRTVAGHASYPGVLVRAGIEDADLIFAVTNDDEVNMIACQVAYSLFQTPTRLARVRSSDYLDHAELFKPSAMPVTYLINPELMVTTKIQRLIENPGALEVLDFADGRVQLVSTRVTETAPMANRTLGEKAQFSARCNGCVAAIFRDGGFIPPACEVEVLPGDELFFYAPPREVQGMIAAFHGNGHLNRRVLIAGGGNLGLRLARLVEQTRQVKIIESDPVRCRYLAGALHRTIVLNGDVTDAELLQSEGVEITDVFCATTDEDRTNIVAAMLAKRLGANKTLAIVNSYGHGELANQAALDIALTPAEVTIGALLTFIRRGDVVAVRSLRGGTAEALEVVARGTPSTSHAVGRTIGELPFPESARVGAILRQERVVLPTLDTVIESDDRVMILLCDKSRIAEVEAIFQVSITFV